MSGLQAQAEHYNARGLSPEAVARSFVAPAHFDAVLSSGNCVLIGPRGSGKTTLLRMLDPRALHEWSLIGDGAASVDYIGVFVPVDAVWVSSLSYALRSEKEDSDAAAYLAVYALSAARAVIDVIRWRISSASLGSPFHVVLNEKLEAELARLISHQWLPGRESSRSFLELRVNLSLEIAELPRKWHRSDDVAKAAVVGNYANPLDLIASTCDVFNVCVGEDGRRWALMCDELEIAPISIQRVLFGALRAAPHPLFLKYSITPRRQIPLGDKAELSLPANDYQVVSLSHATREEGGPEREREAFCIALWRGVVQEMMPSQQDSLENPFKIFEDPNFSSFESTGGRKDRSSGGRASLDEKFGAVFRELAAKDESFNDYLVRKGVVLRNLDECSQLVKDSVVRKVRPLVEIRNYYLSTGSGGVRKASRKASSPYCGCRRIFAISEGHPRWLKFTLAAMLSNLTENLHIRVADQGREIDNSVYRIDARIKALPAKNMSTKFFVDKLGFYFKEQVLGKNFRADPCLSFYVDDGIETEILECLEQALYIGAIIPMHEDVMDVFTRGLVGHRFRLSNWLAPLYRLPLLAGKPANLSVILASSKSIIRDVEPQLSLRFQ